MYATICPQGSGFSVIPKWKKKYRGQSWFSVYNVFVICGALDEENDEELDRFLKWNPLRGFSWSPLAQNTQIKFPSTAKYTHFSHTCTHICPYLRQIQPTQLICLKVNLPYNHHPSSKPAIPNSQTLPHMPTQWNKIPSFIFIHLYISSISTIQVSVPYLL